jgi:ABC-type sugar transport system ATPase subunit
MIDIRVQNLSKKFGDFSALRELNMTFPAGTVTCLLGPSGCGKTTLMRIIAGLETPTTGEVFFGNEPVNKLNTRQRNIGMVFQYPVVYRGINVRQNIELPLLEDKTLSKAERDRRIDEVLDILEMRAAANKEIAELDNGTRQKVACAREVARQPRIILFDEPITNVDINAKLQLKRALKELFTRLKQTIIYVTHDQTEAMTLADQIALMNEGVIAQMASPRELYNKPNDAFAGFFLGNPGMNFFEGLFATRAAGGISNLPIFGRAVSLMGAEADKNLTLGIRPEHVRVTSSQNTNANAVCATVTNKTIVTGGQYLLVLRVGELVFKAKVDSAIGRALGNEAWVEFPLERMRLFGKDGHSPAASLKFA